MTDRLAAIKKMCAPSEIPLNISVAKFAKFATPFTLIARDDVAVILYLLQAQT